MEDAVETGRRLFIGLMPDAEVRAQIVAHQRQWFWPPGSRPTRPSGLHLTLHFLGDDIPHAQETALRGLLRLVRAEPMALTLRTPDCWSSGVAVLRPDEHPALRDLQARLAEPVRLCRLRPARAAFTPHVTLGRDAEGAAPPEATRPIAWPVREFALIWSRKTPPHGYTVLERYGAADQL